MNRAEAALPPSARPARVRSVRRKAEKDITLSVSSKKSPAAIMQSGIFCVSFRLAEETYAAGAEADDAASACSSGVILPGFYNSGTAPSGCYFL